jgi:hypothetical protein
MWPWIIGGLITGALAYAGSLDKEESEGEGKGEGLPKAPDLDKLKSKAFEDGKAAAAAEYKLELQRREAVEKAKREAVDQYRLSQINHQPRGD